MAVTNIPNVQNWTVTPQNGQSGYFDLMNTWLGQSTLVIASLQSAISAQNLANAEINNLASQAENNAIIATGLANYQGEYIALTTYSKGQSVSVAGLYYTSKVDGNSNHAVTDIAYWVANPINIKMDKDINSLTAKMTPVSADELVITDSSSVFSLKKLTFANLLAYFDTLYSRTSVIFGIGQTWQDVTISRASGVTYTNSTGKPIVIAITTVATGGSDILINGVLICSASSSNTSSGIYNSAIVPNGATYKCNFNSTLSNWQELR